MLNQVWSKNFLKKETSHTSSSSHCASGCIKTLPNEKLQSFILHSAVLCGGGINQVMLI